MPLAGTKRTYVTDQQTCRGAHCPTPTIDGTRAQGVCAALNVWTPVVTTGSGVHLLTDMKLCGFAAALASIRLANDAMGLPSLVGSL